MGRRDQSPGWGLTFDDATALSNSLIWARVHLVHRGKQLLVGLQGQVHPAKVEGKGKNRGEATESSVKRQCQHLASVSSKMRRTPAVPTSQPDHLKLE